MATRHWPKMADSLKTSKDGSVITNFGEGVEHHLKLGHPKI